MSINLSSHSESMRHKKKPHLSLRLEAQRSWQKNAQIIQSDEFFLVCFTKFKPQIIIIS